MATRLFRRIANSLPGLELKLKQAGMYMKPEDFIKRTFVSSFYITTGVVVFLFGLISNTQIPMAIFGFVFVMLFFVFFAYMLRVPDAKIVRINREISKEIVFMSRFMLIELESGIPLYDAIKHASKNYETTGKYFKEIIDKVDMGTSMEEAVNEAISFSPSWGFKRVMWQILNTLQTGADISKSMSVVIDQIVREQVIEVDRYGKKLNPIAMFYMIVAVILPSLGITMLIVLASFMGLNLSLMFLFALVFILAFTQFMFVAIIKSSRPAVEM